MATRAHTVPRFYLSGFAAAPDSDRREAFVFVGSIADGSIARRAPKNLSVVRGYYDGPGGFDNRNVTLESHLSRIEWAAAGAIKRLALEGVSTGAKVPPEVWRFVAWQAARTPAWMSIVEADIRTWDPNDTVEVVESTPTGMENIREATRTLTVRHLGSGETREVSFDDYKTMFSDGWRWALNGDDRLEMIHLQAWYFQVRHFPRLHWKLIAPPTGQSFITSDRCVSWSAGGEVGIPPSALRHESAEVLAPLTCRLALIGRREAEPGPVSAREVNNRIALSSIEWIAGSSENVVREALQCRVPA